MFPTANLGVKNNSKNNQKGTHTSPASKETPSQIHPAQSHNHHHPMPFASSYQNHGLATPMSQARSLENLITERSYLFNSLQRENAKATDLLGRILTLEAGIDLEGVPKLQRKMRKQLGWLKHRLGETDQQAKAILARLGQLTYEIQSIDRWTQVEQERLNEQQFLYAPLQTLQGLEPAGMNTVAPVFQQEEFPLPPQWSCVQWLQPIGQVYTQPSFPRDSQEHPFELEANDYDADDEDQVPSDDRKD